jgi:hypothetical protein
MSCTRANASAFPANKTNSPGSFTLRINGGRAREKKIGTTLMTAVQARWRRIDWICDAQDEMARNQRAAAGAAKHEMIATSWIRATRSHLLWLTRQHTHTACMRADANLLNTSTARPHADDWLRVHHYVEMLKKAGKKRRSSWRMYSFMQIEKYEPQFVEINHAHTQKVWVCVHQRDQILVKIEALPHTIFV